MGRLPLEKTLDRCSVKCLIYIVAFKKSETVLVRSHQCQNKLVRANPKLKSKNNYAEYDGLKSGEWWGRD